MMNLLRALRLDHSPGNLPVVSFVGAGGKTTALFQLAHQWIANKRAETVVVTGTTHFGAWQIPLADRHILAGNAPADLFSPAHKGVLFVTGPTQNNRTTPIDEFTLNWLRAECKERNVPLLIEADGSRNHPLKAPAEHEPPIPGFSDVVVVCAGMGAVGKTFNSETVHRPELYGTISGLGPNQVITPEAMIRVLAHPSGGLKNIPPQARRIALLNQADTPELQSIGGSMAIPLLEKFGSVLVGSLQQDNLQTIEHTAGVILAAGESTRYGAPKQLLDWHGQPFVRHIAQTALQAELWPVVVVTGFHAAHVESCLSDLPVRIIRNDEYSEGQSTSIKAGIRSLAHEHIGSAVFLLADQPQIPVEVIRALKETHARDLPAILAPLVLQERRANPVLFDRVTFADLLQLQGDIGGRAIFDKHRVEYLPWHDDILLFDVDKPEDYERLKDSE